MPRIVRRSEKPDSKDVLELKREIDAFLECLGDVPAPAREYIEHRWRPQVVNAKKRMENNKHSYYWWRLPVVVGALSLPPLASPTVEATWARWAALVVSLLVAACTGVETLLRFGNRWRLYRRLLDELRAEGWAYAHRLGPAYARRDADRAFQTFAQRSEDVIRRYGEEYITDVLVLGSSQTDRTAPATAAASAAR